MSVADKYLLGSGSLEMLASIILGSRVTSLAVCVSLVVVDLVGLS